ncbi:hypothetical protein K1T71_007978 [Dendrolimus kikuchii]|uniref:Uncharacterized protein n=1 Tax=Dendrolimus kikuchii TaxID=765133 RepID=A0ACC1CZ88_9NEOP|nr:hypothetical protein K1T71_007978 [Dendrolimus kikuchii]
MSENKSSLRIDWFDGTLIEDTRSNIEGTSSQFADEDQLQTQEAPKPQHNEKKPIGFKRLLDLSLLKPPILNLEISHRPGFWNLLDVELKGDFIVLIVKILANIYKSLEPGEKSKIVGLLKSRFKNSNFLVNLKTYIRELPSVRIVEKRMNFYLWEDIQSFYVHILNLCEGIIDFGGNNEEFLKEIYDLLEITQASVIGVMEEHSERFSDDLFIKIEELKNRTINENYSKEFLGSSLISSTDEFKDKNHFKNLNIFPTRNDLLGSNDVIIQPNIINGAYPNIEHYLDIQFKLLREDCFGPLREGISKYMQNPSKRRHENIRVHPKVRFIRTYVSNNKVGYLVDIAWQDRASNGLVDCKRYAYSKQLMFGSLLLFTNDNFDTILCATVLDSNKNLLQDGYVIVYYLMLNNDFFNTLAHKVKQTNPPTYLSNETFYTIKDTNNEEIVFPVLDIDQWPVPFDFDNSQNEAYKFALTHEFAVIQGPPGTGKTFLGIKIASTILKNLSLEGTPMLIICYTNHALDQFLEGLLDTTKSVIRLGSQSKSKILEPYSLHNARMKVKSKYGYLYASKRTELEKIFNEMTELQSEIEKCEKEIVCYKMLKPHLKIGDKCFELLPSKEDPVLTWLFRDGKEYEEPKDLVKEDDWENVVEESDKIDTCFSDKWALKEIDSMLNSIKYVKDVTDDHMEGQKMVDKFEEQIIKVRKRIDSFKRYKALFHSDVKKNIKLPKVDDIYSLNTEQKWQVYYSAVDIIKNGLTTKMSSLLEQHNRVNEELNEVSTLTDGEVMRTVRVVGVTTTTAARRHDLMKKLLLPIVIVEEAAEVLEAHIVASLTNHCQHLVLIGDHKQLRPTAAHYKLAKDYNLEISLFERMVRNNVHSRALTIQRRMRPKFVNLLVPVIYEKLESHTSVDSYESVRGMADDLWFCTHNVYEDNDGSDDSWSHKNTFEAKWCVALANYLRQMNYTSDEVTILSTYNGQVTLLRELSKKYNLLRDVKITAVDNFQGEESRIVILSLVRSNRDGNIGFLTAANRICVALSRAKEGFYIFGNMNVLTSASSIWRFINDRLVEMNAIGRHIRTFCQKHPENIVNMKSCEDFDDISSGSCFRICLQK